MKVLICCNVYDVFPKNVHTWQIGFKICGSVAGESIELGYLNVFISRGKLHA